MIHEFDTIIYPFTLWVSVGVPKEKMQERFPSIADVDNDEFKRYEAITFKVVDSETSKHGVLVWFRKRKFVTCKTIAHEATHAAGFLFSSIGTSIDADEPSAYMVGWIADCCWKVRNIKKTKRNEADINSEISLH